MNKESDKRVLKFHNELKLTRDEIEEIFSSYGKCSSIWEKKDQIYVMYADPESAQMAINSIGYKLYIEYDNLSESELPSSDEAVSYDPERYSDHDKPYTNGGSMLTSNNSYYKESLQILDKKKWQSCSTLANLKDQYRLM